MASSNAGNSAEGQNKSRKRKRNSDIPGFAPSTSSTPVVSSQAPRAINAEQFASARAVEIKNMVTAIEEADKSKGKRVFQTLPRHMRRRAMSHNVKRMPVRLRQRASYEMHNPANKPETKKKSRHHRRQPKNLLEEYNRRQRKHIWLETHIWHAKRMKMIDAWGYRLADHPNDKGFRAAYRAVKNNCILQDLSYYGCIEMCGVQSKIIQAMCHLTSQEAGLTMAAKYFLNGMREGNVMLYKFDQFPTGAISPVSFLWRQMRRKTETATNTKNVQHFERQESERQNVENDVTCTTQDHSLVEAGCRIHEKEANSQLWVWCHPASFDSVFDAITEACKSVGRTLIEKDIKLCDVVDKDSVVNTEHPDQGAESIPLVNGVDQSELKVTSLRHDLLRLRLTGPQSHGLLTSTLKLHTELKYKHSENKSSTHVFTSHKASTSVINDKGVNNSSSKWWQKALDDPSDSLAQSALWEKLKKAFSPAVLPPRCVFGVTVLDPRLYLPGKKKSMTCTTEEDNEESDSNDETVPRSGDLVISADEAVSKPGKDMPSFEHVVSNWPSDVACSHIWDQAVRREVKETKMTEQELNQKRSELLVPSSQLNLKPDEISHIPVLLIQQPGWSGNSRDAGVGLGCGSGWDIVLPSGWAMAFWIAFVYRGARTGALRESRTIALEQGVPFFPNDFPDTPAGEAHNKQLKEDGEARYKCYPPAKRPNYDKLGVKSPFCPPWRELVKDWRPCEAASGNAADKPMEISSDSFKNIPVASESPDMDFSAVQPFYVLRSRSKLSSLRSCVLCDKKPRKRGFKHNVTTSHTPSLMDDLSSVAKNNLNSLVCVLVRMVNRNVPVPNSALAIPSTEDISRLTKGEDSSGPIEPLHKGPRAQPVEKSLRNSCTREIVGFVSSGHFSLARGCGFGVGFCALPGLVKLISSARKTGEVVVLVRGPSTQQYRFAYLTIL